MPWRTIKDPERLAQLVEAVLSVGSDLSLPDVLRRIVEAAVDLIGAKYGALGVLDDRANFLVEFINVGLTVDEVATIGDLPEGHGILGLLIVDPQPLRLPDLTQHSESFGFPPGHPAMRSFLGVPITIRDRVYGNLYLTEKRTAAEFSEEDESLAVALAGAAAIAIDNARLFAKSREAALGEDRDRIAADLHDRVIQRLFATGLALEGTIQSVSPDVATRLERAVNDLDETIRQIRSAIFAMQTPRNRGNSLRSQVMGVAREASRTLGFDPGVWINGPLDSAVPPDVGPEVVAVITEALANVARHAQATSADLTVNVDDDELMVSVGDNGLGLVGDTSWGSGLRNMAQRAELLGGSVQIAVGPDQSGTLVSWRVPLRGRS